MVWAHFSSDAGIAAGSAPRDRGGRSSLLAAASANTRAKESTMRAVVRVLLAVALLLFGTTRPTFAECSDPAAAAAVRAECDCASANNHGAYVSCVAHATNAAVKDGTLPEDCASTVMNCASNSTCGKPGFVTCCETDASGTTKCNVVNGPDACTAPKGGSACVGTQPSCCDACSSGECGGGGGTTTSTVASTTSTVATTTSTEPTATTTTTSTTNTTGTTGTSTTTSTTNTTGTTGTSTTTSTTNTTGTTATTTSTSTTSTTGTTATTTTTSTTTTTVSSCSCAGGAPSQISFTTGVGSGTCGHLASDTSANFLSLNCGGLYFGGAGVGVPLPSTVPDQGKSFRKAACTGTALTLSGTSPTEAGGNRCAGGSNHHNACTTNADCPGGTCKFLQCTNAGCLFGPPLPIPNRSHQGAATSSCVINSITANAAGTANCSTGSTTGLNVPLSSGIFLDADLMAMRCSGGSTPGANCTGSAGPNDGLACTPGDGALGGEYPTSHDCPPPPANNLGALPIAFVLDSGTVSKTSVDLPDQANVFCGFCKNKSLNTFARRCNGLASGAACTCAVGVPCAACSGAPCLPVACTANTDCAAVTGFVSCGQRTSGAFCSGDPTSAVNPCSDLARTIVETGAPAGALTTGGPAKPAKLASIFCIPLTFSSLVDSAADLPGPGAVALQGTTQAFP